MFRIGQSSIHGMGWFATRNIPADTPIFDEQVCIRLPVDLSRDSGDPNLLEEFVSKLPKDQETAFRSLEGNDLLDKVWMNGSPLIDFEKDPLGLGPRRDLGIYLQCARLNHSCIPNAVRASDKGNVMGVVAQKDILAGEEITISYMDDNLAPSEDRERQMRSKIRVGKYWTGCGCPLCSGSDEKKKKASDNRRRQLFVYRERLMQGTLSKMDLATEFLPLMAAEGLPATLMGMDATMKMMTVLSGIDFRGSSPDTANAYCFQKGVRVVMHKLQAKPELNGKMGTVAFPLNKITGRIGILLDDPITSENKPVAIKPENLCLVRKGSSGAAM
jgi:SET domain